MLSSRIANAFWAAGLFAATAAAQRLPPEFPVPPEAAVTRADRTEAGRDEFSCPTPKGTQCVAVLEPAAWRMLNPNARHYRGEVRRHG